MGAPFSRKRFCPARAPLILYEAFTSQPRVPEKPLGPKASCVKMTPGVRDISMYVWRPLSGKSCAHKNVAVEKRMMAKSRQISREDADLVLGETECRLLFIFTSRRHATSVGSRNATPARMSGDTWSARRNHRVPKLLRLSE